MVEKSWQGYRDKLEGIIRRKWTIPRHGERLPQEQQKVLSRLLNTLAHIAVHRHAAQEEGKPEPSAISFKRINNKEAHTEMWAIRPGTNFASLHYNTRLAAANAGLSQDNVETLSEEELQRRLRQAIKHLPRKTGVGTFNPRGPKVEPLTREIALLLIRAYRHLKGVSGEVNTRKGLQAAATEVFWLLNIRSPHTKPKNAIASALAESSTIRAVTQPKPSNL